MTCSGCGKEKIMWAFATFKTRRGETRRRGVCKDCRGLNVKKKFSYYQKWRRAYNKRNRTVKALRDAARRSACKTYVDKIKAKTPCADCGERFPAICMDFDHLKGKNKSVSGLVSGAYRLELIKEEIAKCEIVCSNCHRLRTKRRKQNHAPINNPRARRGSEHPNAKLSVKHVIAIRSEYKIGDRADVIARRYGIARNTVYGIVYRHSWRHVK